MPSVLTAVADSTMLVSAFVRPEGLSALLLRHAAGGDFELHLSHEIIGETQTTLLEREHIRRRYRYTNDEVDAFCQLLSTSFSLVTDLPTVTGVVRDPNDDMVIATAVRAQASYIVTRDDDLLSLQTYENITIVTPEVFIAMVRGRSRSRDQETPL
jgi:putative PIN family toxin of toxin-antitoxin system